MSAFEGLLFMAVPGKPVGEVELDGAGRTGVAGPSC